MSREKRDLPDWFKGLTYNEVKRCLQKIKDKRDQALFMTIYACYGRVGEVVKGWDLGKPNPNSKPLKRQHVDLVPHPRRPKFLRISLFTLKNHEERKVYVACKREKWLAKPIWEHARKLDIGEFLFTGKKGALNSRQVQRLFCKYFSTPYKLDSENVHLMRGWRLTHGARGDFTNDKRPYPIEAQMQEGGWRTSDIPLRIYNQTKAEEFLKLKE